MNSLRAFKVKENISQHTHYSTFANKMTFQITLNSFNW